MEIKVCSFSKEYVSLSPEINTMNKKFGGIFSIKSEDSKSTIYWIPPFDTDYTHLMAIQSFVDGWLARDYI